MTQGGNIFVDRECNDDFRTFTTPTGPTVPPSTIAHAELPIHVPVFVGRVELRASVDVDAGLTVRLVLNYRLPDGWWCGSTTRIDHASYLETPPMLSPDQGSWHFGNGMTQIGFSQHAQYH
jgi:hypothetical protein